MRIEISTIFTGIKAQQLPALIGILSKAKDYAEQANIDQAELLATRLTEDMHPLQWQIQATLQLALRGTMRLAGQEPEDLTIDENGFDAIIARVEQVLAQMEKFSDDVLNQHAIDVFEVPVGPDITMPMTGQEYALKFVLPNFYFHLTTSYNILRMKGVPLGKRDFLGAS